MKIIYLFFLLFNYLIGIIILVFLKESFNLNNSHSIKYLICHLRLNNYLNFLNSMEIYFDQIIALVVVFLNLLKLASEILRKINGHFLDNKNVS